jgi:N-acetylmuramoyl-L-alanine amidase
MVFDKIFIDAGHNCRGDGGAAGNGMKEDNYTLAVQKKLLELFDNAYDVNPPRTTASLNSSLAIRVNNANKLDGDNSLYVSLHHNAANSPQANGVEVFHFRGNEAGRRLASELSQELSNELGMLNRGAKAGNFYVLRETNMSAILVETGFVTNLKDASIIKVSVDEIAKTIFNVVSNFK